MIPTNGVAVYSYASQSVCDLHEHTRAEKDREDNLVALKQRATHGRVQRVCEVIRQVPQSSL